jgi:hypothetical protein
MANESLARIMYGTSEEVHVSSHTVTLPGLAANQFQENSGQSAAGEETLGELLHRVWHNISHKQ